jgi:hypothetical protein
MTYSNPEVNKLWKRFRRKYWKEMVRVFNHHLAEEGNNAQRMHNGDAPGRWAVLRNNRDGHLFEKFVKVELHHVFGRKDDIPQEYQAVIECWPWEHSAMDDDRKINFSFVRWGRLK